VSVCSSCHSDNPPQAAFCRHCGAALADPAAGASGAGPAPAEGPASRSRRRRARRFSLLAVVLLVAVGAVVGFLILTREQAPPTPAPAPLSWTTIGSSVQDRPIEAASFGAGTGRRVLVIGGVHGGEYGARAAKQFAVYLHAHPETVPAGATIDIIHCLNPDGAAADTRGNAHHVDLNRNMPTPDWRGQLSAKDQSRYMFHCNGGTSPGSEPETRVLLAQLRKGYDAVLSLHSHGGILDANGPGGRSLAKRMSVACGLKLGAVTYDAYITGSMGRYIPEKLHIPIVTVELDSPRLSRRMIEALLVPAR
jgi:protein MpaA